MEIKHYLKNVYCGKIAQRYGIETAMGKASVATQLHLSIDGLSGDEFADKMHHGGPDRALHQYPVEHYAYWQDKYGTSYIDKYAEKVSDDVAGMGENISSAGMTEETVCLGDRYQWGEAIIEVSQPRSPCFNLNTRWGIDSFAVDMQEVSRCGWLYRVIRPGIVSVEQPLELMSRVDNAMTIKAVCDIYFGDPLNTEKLLVLSQQSTLADSWMHNIEQRLTTNEVEDWHFRLHGYAKKSEDEKR